MARAIQTIISIVLLAALSGYALCTRADVNPHPLAPPDLSSPRATLMNFLALMETAHRHWTPTSRPEQERAERNLIAHVAHQFFDLNDIAPTARKNVGRETAVYMKEVLDRVDLPAWDQIPDADAVAAHPHLTQWTIPHTEITLVRISKGVRQGQWVFSSETDDRVPEFYERVKQLAYKPGATEGLYELFVSEPGPMIPRGLIRALPSWMQTRFAGQSLWQWSALVLTLIVTTALMVLVYRITRRVAGGRHGFGYYAGAVFPVFAVVLPQAATDFLSEQVFITGRLFEIVDFALDLVSLGALIVVILGLTNRLATALTALPWSKERQLTAQLAQLVVRAIGVAGALVAVFEGGRYLGVPLTTLIAGVSVSGLTVALAAQDTLKNLFGSLMILLDRPFQVGDLIRIKGHEGRVESVGLRSTRIRDVSGHVVSISNEEMARLDSKNLSSRNHLRRQEVLRLRADTRPERIQSFVEFIRGILDKHEGFDARFPPSVRIGFGDAAVSITITYYYGSPSSTAFAAFNEQVTLRILERLQLEGIELAPAGHATPIDGRGSEHEAHEKHEAGHTLHEPAFEAPDHSTHRTDIDP